MIRFLVTLFFILAPSLSCFAAERVFYLTGLEGNGERLKSWVRNHPSITWNSYGGLQFKDSESLFVYGGGATGAGTQNQWILKTLVDFKIRYRDRVILIAGDAELFQLRLQNVSTAAKDYLKEAQLIFRWQDSLFVYGAITELGAGWIPSDVSFEGKYLPNVDKWIQELNLFYRTQIQEWSLLPAKNGGRILAAYQSYLGGVVFGKYADSLGMPALPGSEALNYLNQNEIKRVITGNTHQGETLTWLQSSETEFLLANSEEGIPLIELSKGVSRITVNMGEDKTIDQTVHHAKNPWIGKKLSPEGSLVIGKDPSNSFYVLKDKIIGKDSFTHSEVSESDLLQAQKDNLLDYPTDQSRRCWPKLIPSQIEFR